MARAGFEMVRYADDFVILCPGRSRSRSGVGPGEAVDGTGGIGTAPDKTRLVDVTQRGGFDFLGYHFERGYRWPRKKSLQKIKETLRGKTKRTNGRSLDAIIRELNLSLRGWFGYFQHSHPTTFTTMDKWVRGRLRSILRKRSKRKGRARGEDHKRWPNAFFQQQRLFSLELAYAQTSQSCRR